MEGEVTAQMFKTRREKNTTCECYLGEKQLHNNLKLSILGTRSKGEESRRPWHRSEMVKTIREEESERPREDNKMCSVWSEHKTWSETGDSMCMNG